MYISDETDFECIKKIILEKKYFRNKGKNVESECSIFEKKFAETIGTNYSLLVTSGTNALVCALKSLNLKQDDEVIIPAYTFFSTAAAVLHSNATPVIININNQLLIDPTEIEKNITKKTKAIIVVHMDGFPCEMDSIMAIAKKYSLKVIEDCAQAVGGSFKKKRLGSIGDFGCFSFNVDKIISCGEGGAITLNDRLFYERSLCIQDTSCFLGPTFRDEFTQIKPFIGESMRVSELSGALMNNQLKKLDQILIELRHKKSLLTNILRNQNIDYIKSNDEGECATSILFKLNSYEHCKSTFKLLNENKIISIPLSLRTGHTFWNWLEIIKVQRPNYPYSKAKLLSSINLISTSLKINIPYEYNDEQIISFANTISKIIGAS